MQIFKKQEQIAPEADRVHRIDREGEEKQFADRAEDGFTEYWSPEVDYKTEEK